MQKKSREEIGNFYVLQYLLTASAIIGINIEYRN
jgi:hypothetical protein